MREIDRLRQQVIARQRAAGKKISRIKSNTGAVIAGTEFDPRTARQNVNRMRSRELRAQLRRIESFIARPTQFVADAENRPVPRATFRRYKTAEAAANALKAKRMEKMGDIQMPVGTYTIKEYHAAFHANMGPVQRRTMLNNVDVFPFDRRSTDFTSGSAIEQMARHLERSLTPAQRAKKARLERSQAEKMIEVLNNKDLSKMLGQLSDDQFDALWHSTDFARSASLSYEFAMGRAGEDPWIIERFENEVDLAGQMINWASKLKL